MTLLVPWLLFPIALGTLALGCGLLAERAAGRRIPGPLLLPVGLATLTVVAGFSTWSGSTAELTVPLVVGLAAGGFGLRLRVRRIDPYALACALVAFVAVGAPVLASGEATFAGYVKLDDTATFLALTDRVLEHGRDLDGLAPSTYEATLAVNLEQGYPTGALLPLGAGARLAGTDPAWVFHPYLAFLAAMLASSLYALARPLLPGRLWRALAATFASQSALLYGFALWGGVKELYAAAALALVAATVALVHRRAGSGLPCAIAAASLILALSPGGVVWLAAPLAALVAASRTKTRGVVVAGLGAALLALPALAAAGRFLRADNRASFRDAGELGNLIRPLDPSQLLGIWPTSDFRLSPGDMRTTVALLGITLAAAALGLLFALTRPARPLVVYVAACGIGAVAYSAVGSPWLEAKAYAVASPGILLLALVGSARLIEYRRPVAVLALATIAGGVTASNALAYRDARLAPREQLVELERIGHRFAGQGPALMTEYQPYGVRHFLRHLDAEGASELRRRPVPLRDGRVLGKGEVAPIDAFAPDAVLVYRTLVLRREASVGRPPQEYRLVWSGRYYDVWQRR